MDIRDREKLVEAFEHMVESVHKSIHDAEEALAPTVDEMVHNAEELARELYALTQEEAHSLGETLRRDLHKANRVLNQQGKEVREWLSFDLALAGDRFIDLIARAADKTWLDFRAFEAGTGLREEYRAGEVCSAGSLRCVACGEVQTLERASQIETCAACGHGIFRRVSADDAEPGS